MLIHTNINKPLSYMQFYWNFPLDSLSFSKSEKLQGLVKVLERLQLFCGYRFIGFLLTKPLKGGGRILSRINYDQFTFTTVLINEVIHQKCLLPKAQNENVQAQH